MSVAYELKLKRAELANRLEELAKLQAEVREQVSCIDKVIAIYEPGYEPTKTVPEVTVKTALQTLSGHLKRPRLIVWQRSVLHFGQYGSPSVSGQRIFLNQPWAVSSRTLARSMTVSVRHSGDSRKCCPFGCRLDFATAQSPLGLEGGWAAYFQASGRDRDVHDRRSRLHGDKGDGEWDGGHVQAPGCMRTASAAATGPPTKSKLYVGRPEHGIGLIPGRRAGVDRLL